MTIDSEPIVIQYRTETSRRRRGWAGWLFEKLSQHPILVGIGGGLVAAAIALATSPGVVETAPLAAGVLAFLVVLIWVAMLRVMRPFFEQQTHVTQRVVRAISYDGHTFCWMEEERNLVSLESPSFRLYTSEVPDETAAREDSGERPWPVWLVVSDEDARFVLETKVAISEAADYPPVGDDVISKTDELLPTHVASPLLVLGRSEHEG